MKPVWENVAVSGSDVIAGVCLIIEGNHHTVWYSHTYNTLLAVAFGRDLLQLYITTTVTIYISRPGVVTVSFVVYNDILLLYYIYTLRNSVCAHLCKE